MDILKKFRKGKKPLSADVIALLAQAHQIHEAELAFARDEAREEARAELRQKVRDALTEVNLPNGKDGRTCVWGTQDIYDLYLAEIGKLFADTYEQEHEWKMFVRERRLAANEGRFQALHQQIEKSNRRSNTLAEGVPYQVGENGTHASGGVVASW